MVSPTLTVCIECNEQQNKHPDKPAACGHTHISYISHPPVLKRMSAMFNVYVQTEAGAYKSKR